MPNREAPTDQVPVAAAGITQTSWLHPPQAVMLLSVRRLAQAPASARLPGGPRAEPGFSSLRLGFGLWGQAWPCAGRWAGIHFLAASGQGPRVRLAVNCRPFSASRGCHVPWLVAPASTFKASDSGPSLPREPSVWLSAAPCDWVESTQIIQGGLPTPRSFCRGRAHPQGPGVRAWTSWGGGESHCSTNHIAGTKAQDKTNRGSQVINVSLYKIM